MNLYFRMLRVLVSAFFRPRLAPTADSLLQFRVWPTDLDVSRHMNNGRYLTVMDLGRLDLMMRTGLGRLVLRERWMPLVATCMVRFKRSLLPFERFAVRSRLLGWDEKWLYLEQEVVRDSQIVTHALFKTVIRRSGGHVPPAELFSRLGREPVESPDIPQPVRALMEAEDRIRA
ncbi:MAG: thioesterase family protein [Gammaproteobacteria bacterium]|jgi:acyl-CoA thioesterase FadM